MGLGSRKSQLLSDRQSTSDVHRLISTISTVAAFQLVVMNVRDNGGGACDVTVNIGNNCVLIRSVLMSARNGCTFIYPKFNLDVENQQSSCRRDETHVKDMKNPVEVRPPVDDRLFIVLRVITSGDRVPFTPLDDVPLDLARSSD